MDSSNDTFLKKLLETFAQEAKEHIDNLSNALLELKKNNDPEISKSLVEVLFREAHSFKGASRAVNITEIEEVCKTMEDIFNIYKKSAEKIPDYLIEAILESNDLLSLLSKADETNRRELKPQVQEMIKQMQLRVETIDSVETQDLPPYRQDQKEKETISADMKQISTLPKSDETKKRENFTSKKEPSDAGTIRISVKKLNNIMIQTEEMLFAKIASKRNVDKLQMIIDEIGGLTTELLKGEYISHDMAAKTTAIESMLFKVLKQAKADTREIYTIVDRLLVDMKEALMLPFSTLFYTLPKIVHDIAKSVNKDIILNVIGGDIEIDRRILEEMSDPLMHLLRNSIDHGIEDPLVRLEKGKKQTGTITLSLTQKSGSKIELSVHDDGAGIDSNKIIDLAIERGVIDKEKAEGLDRESALNLIFLSGISTAKIVTNLSGRGLGLAIVQEKAEQLGGHVSIESTEYGSELKLLLPLTMATFRGIQTSLKGQKFIFPIEHVAFVMTAERNTITHIEGKEIIIIDHHVVPFYLLSDILELDAASNESTVLSVVVIVLGANMLAIGVDAIDCEEEVMVKSLGKQLSRVKNIAGATLLPSDVPALILNISDIFKSAGMVSVKRVIPEKEIMKRKQKILVADDSLTTRTLLKNIMEMSGYEVRTAFDGLDAYEILKKEPFDLVISDVDMPRMNGFELTESIRADSQLSDLPVVIITSLESSEDKERGMHAGANAYIVKSSFDQNMLSENIKWLLD